MVGRDRHALLRGNVSYKNTIDYQYHHFKKTKSSPNGTKLDYEAITVDCNPNGKKFHRRSDASFAHPYDAIPGSFCFSSGEKKEWGF